MKAAAVILVCFLMVPSATALFISGEGQDRTVKVNEAGQVAPSLVPPAPGNTQKFSEPFHGVDPSRHPRPPTPTAQITGSEPLLVILINLNDTANSSTHTPTYFTNLVFNSSQNSMNKFYKDNSYNQFCITGNVTSKFYTATHNLSWYGRYETTSPPPMGYGNAQNLTYDAVMAADADINYADYDRDNDGWVDHLMIVHAGGDQAYTGQPNDIWSHSWAMSSPVQLDGKYLYYYTTLSENDPVGIYVHEFGHDIGLPDLYDTDYSTSGGVGDWDVMASGSWNGVPQGSVPAQFSAWCKQEMGWLAPTLVSADTAGINAKRVEDNMTGAVYKVWVNFSNNEYFLVENRQQTGWDSALPGNGLLIWHINDTAWSNSNEPYRIVDLEEYDNNDGASEANDPWKSNPTGFTPATAPNSNDYSGRSTGIRIFNISASGNTMIFDVALANVAPNAPVPSAPGDQSWTKLARPELGGSFSDSNGGDSQTAYRVQVDDDSAFGSVNWDSGDTVSGSTSCTVGSSLAEGRWYWHVRTRDFGGLWGPYNSATVRSVRIDLTAPAAPVGPSAAPSSWTATNSFTLNWTMPAESGTSGIATGAYYKLDAVPSGPTDGTWVASTPISGITVSGSGTHTVYIWLLDNVGNVNHVNRASSTLYFDNAAPANPSSLTSSTHTASTWSNKSVVQLQWSGASDTHSGLDGFSYVWDNIPGTIPDTTKDCEETVATTSSMPLADGIYYFHIRAVDNVGNWAGSAVHAGPFWIDRTSPRGVDSVLSSSHQTGVWSNLNVISMSWSGASDGSSGVGGYSIAWDNVPGTIPDDTTDATTPPAQSPPLGDGAGYYFHVRVRDAVFNWNSTAFHLGPFNIDTTPPENPSGYSVLTNNTVDVWSSNRVIRVEWSGFSDALSGVDGFSVVWDGSPLTVPGIVKGLEEDRPSTTSQALLTGVYYLHIRTKDNAGNWNAGAKHIGPFRVDTDKPSSVAAMDEGEFGSSAELQWSWPAATDEHSGVAGYIVSLGTSAGADNVLRNGWTDTTSFTLSGAQDGRTYYLHVMAVDRVGNRGEWGASSDGITVDLSPPAGVRMSINGGAVSTGNQKVDVHVMAFDAVSGLSNMRFSQDGSNWTDWSAFSAGRILELAGVDGSKTFYCQVRDTVGNAAAPVQATILLDTTGPAITGLRTPDGRSVSASPDIFIELEARDAYSGVTHVRLSPDGTTWGPWQPYGQMYDWELARPDGQKQVLAQARDCLGNTGPSANMSIVLDTTAPAKPAVTSSTHPGGSLWYNSTVASIRWTAPQDTTGIAGYSFIFTTSDSDMPFGMVTTTTTELSVPVPGEGRWHFRIMAVDGAGNWGQVADHVLLIDTRGPAPPALDAPVANSDILPGPVQLLWRAATDNPSGVKGYQLQLANDEGYTSLVFDGVVDTTSYTTGSLEQGNYFWRLRARDGAGNWGDYSAPSVFAVRRPVPPSPQSSAGTFELSNPFMLVVAAVILVAIIAGIAGAAMRRRKRPGAGQDEGWPAEAERSPVQWEP